MAYDPTYLSGPYHFGGKGGQQLFCYTTADSAATIAGTGYISDASKRQMKAGDVVIVTQQASLPDGNGTGINAYVVASVSGGAATIIKTATA